MGGGIAPAYSCRSAGPSASMCQRASWTTPRSWTSDLDILVIVERSDEPRWFMRAWALETSGLSVGADLFVYTAEEARLMETKSAWFGHVLGETMWLEQPDRASRLPPGPGRSR
jgi:hypothetical protein